jgi:phosphate uptake regulator
MTEPSFDLSVYLRTAPVITIESGILLARTLLAILPKSLPAHVKKSAAKLGRVADEAQAALSQRKRELVVPQDESSRDVDAAADLIWSSLRDVLESLSRLADHFERAAKAKQLLAAIFPEGVAFLRLPYAEQYVTMDTTLQRIDSEGLAKSLDAVVGPELLQQIRAVHPRYGAMVARRLKEAAPAASLLDHVRALQRTILEYATAVASTVDSDEPATIALARTALRPIDNHREQVGSGKRPSPSDPSSPDPTPPEPTPDSQ